MIKKYCWKCKEIEEFSDTTLKYVKDKVGSDYTCLKCTKKWYLENKLKEVKRILTPESMFSCKFEYEYNK